MSKEMEIKQECCNIWNNLKDKTQMIDFLIESKMRIVELEEQLNKKKTQKAVKKTLYITSDLNDKGEELGINFSLMLRESLKKEIERIEKCQK